MIISHTYHPSKPQAGLTGRTESDVGRGDIGRRLQGLDLSGRLARWTGTHNIDLPHSEPKTKRYIMTHSLQRLFMIISHHVTAGGPVVGVGVQSLNFKRSRVRLIGQLMDRYPLLIFSNNADLKSRESRNINGG